MVQSTKVPVWALRQRQSLPLDSKVRLAEIRIRQWYEHWHGQVYVSFSGGKDSTVLLHIVRELYKNTPAVFVNTGLEFPEILEFVRSTPDVTWLKPDMSFKKVLETYGYPIVSKEQAGYLHEIRHAKSQNRINQRLYGKMINGRPTSFCLSKKWRFLVNAPFAVSDQCCVAMKKRPMDKYVKETGRQPIMGVMASDSSLRKQQYLKYGCNAFTKRPASRPLSVWTSEDVWAYIESRKLRYSTIYDMGYERTGCIFCGFGAHLEKEPNRFQRLRQTHPKLWKYCMDKLGLRGVLEYIGVPVDYEDDMLESDGVESNFVETKV